MNQREFFNRTGPKRRAECFASPQTSAEMLKEWQDIHAGAKADAGVLATEINHAVGSDAVLVHHVFKDAGALVNYFETTATQHMRALTEVAKPEQHLFRGIDVPAKVREAAKVPHADFGEFLFGFVKDDYRAPDQKTAIQVTAKWTAKSDADFEELKHWWQVVGAANILSNLRRNWCRRRGRIRHLHRKNDVVVGGGVFARHRPATTCRIISRKLTDVARQPGTPSLLLAKFPCPTLTSSHSCMS